LEKTLQKIFALLLAFLITSCATIVNDPTVPVTLSFSDGSEGRCKVTNKRINLDLAIPGTHQIRRSDDPLVYDCETETGKTAFGSIPSEMEGAKLVGSVFFFDLGITDSITDKHRTYTPNFVIPVK
tara:strand:+ start:209 stop:586 length:378 start_codon:yes stop_codon:yes gene_type:complete